MNNIKKSFLQSEYLWCGLILLLCHVFVNAFGWPFDNFDYILIVYILYLNRINVDTALAYALVFGLAYDISYPVFLGLGILLFQLLNYIKIKASTFFDVNKSVFALLFTVFIIVIYFMLTLKFNGYTGDNFWLHLLKYLKYNVILLALIVIISGRINVFSCLKR